MASDGTRATTSTKASNYFYESRVRAAVRAVQVQFKTITMLRLLTEHNTPRRLSLYSPLALSLL